MTAPKTLTEADAKQIAEQVVAGIFETMGFDISTREGRIQAQGAFRHLMTWYRIWGIGTRAGIGAAVAAAVAYAGYKLFGWGGPP